MRLSFDDIASQFDHQRGLPLHAIRAWVALIDELSDGHQMRLVEPGIGTGRISLPLAALGHHIIGTDISVPMLEACRQAADRLEISPLVDLVEADAANLPFNDHAFDLGIIAQLLYLVPAWPTVLDELARVVKSGGFVIHLTEPTTESDALALWSSTWRKIIESTGYRHTELSPTDIEVRAEFLRRWPDVEVRQLAAWSFGQTVAEAIDGYATRVRPLYGAVPVDAFNQVVADFLAWAEETFPDSNTRLDGSVTLTALIVRT